MAKSAALALSLMLFTLFSVHLKAQDMSCLGRTDDPKQDFYAKKLNNIIDYNNAAAAELAKLEKKNKELATDIDYLAKRRIPALIERLKQSDGKIDEALAKEIAIQQAQYMENRAGRETGLTGSDQRAESTLLLEMAALLKKEAGFYEEFDKVKAPLLEKLRAYEAQKLALKGTSQGALDILMSQHNKREKGLYDDYERKKAALLVSTREYEKKLNFIELKMQKAAELLTVRHDKLEKDLYANYERDKANLSASVREYDKKINALELRTQGALKILTDDHVAREKELYTNYNRDKANLLVSLREYENKRNEINNAHRRKQESLATLHRLEIERLTNSRRTPYDKKLIEAEEARYRSEKDKNEVANEAVLARLIKPSNETITRDFENALRQEQARFERAKTALLSAEKKEREVLVKPSNEKLAQDFENAMRNEQARFERAKAALLAAKERELSALIKPTNETLSQDYEKAMREEQARFEREKAALATNKDKALAGVEALIAQTEAAIAANNTNYFRNLKIIEGAREILEKKKEDQLAANKKGRDDLYNNDYNSHIRKIADYRRRLTKPKQMLVDEMMEETKKMNNKAKEMMGNATGRPRPANITDAMYAASPEKYLQYQGIDEIRKNLEKFKLIALWWKEQGRKNDGITDNEAGALCGDIDCEKRKKSPLEVLLLKKSCIEDSITHKSSTTDQIMCNDSTSSAGTTKNMCVTKRMADYTHWSLNNALKCLSSPSEPIDPQLLFRKLNNESTFRFFYSYSGGQGLMQTINIAQNEVLGLSGGGAYRSQGRKNLADVMANNSSQCGEYTPIFDFKNENRYDELAARAKRRTGARGAGTVNELATLRQEYPEYNRRLFDQGQASTCDFVSLEAGIHRNILSGMGLYLHYRNLADADLQELVPDMKKNKDYHKMRDLVAFVYYGPDGPGGGKTKIKSILPAIRGALPKMTAAQFEQKLKGIGYVAAMQASENAVAQRTGRKVECVE